MKLRRESNRRNPHFDQKSTFWSKNDLLVQNYYSHFHQFPNFGSEVIYSHSEWVLAGGPVEPLSVCLSVFVFSFWICIFICICSCICTFSNFGSEVTYPHSEWVFGGGPVEPLSTPLCQPDNTSPGPYGYLPLCLYLCIYNCICICIYSCICIIVHAMSLSTPHRLPHSINTKNIS